MGNVCACCKWGQRGHEAKAGKKEVWFDHDSTPLVTAKYDLNEIGSNEADGLLKKKVLIRSPRPASVAAETPTRSSSRPSRHPQRHYELEERPHQKHRVNKAASVDSSSISKRSKYCVERGSPERRSNPRHIHHLSRETDDNDEVDRRIARSTSLEVWDSTREMRSPSSPARSFRVLQDLASLAHDEGIGADSFHGPMRSHRSSSNESLSPNASSKSYSPYKKLRYGRKHYRADANRK